MKHINSIQSTLCAFVVSISYSLPLIAAEDHIAASFERELNHQYCMAAPVAGESINDDILYQLINAKLRQTSIARINEQIKADIKTDILNQNDQFVASFSRNLNHQSTPSLPVRGEDITTDILYLLVNQQLQKNPINENPNSNNESINLIAEAN